MNSLPHSPHFYANYIAQGGDWGIEQLIRKSPRAAKEENLPKGPHRNSAEAHSPLGLLLHCGCEPNQTAVSLSLASVPPTPPNQLLFPITPSPPTQGTGGLHSIYTITDVSWRLVMIHFIPLSLLHDQSIVFISFPPRRKEQKAIFGLLAGIYTKPSHPIHGLG